jgi:hypothetical protein
MVPKEARTAPSPDVPATTVAGLVHADQANRCQSSALTCRVSHHSGMFGPRLTSEQRPEQRPHQSCPSPQWLAETTPTDRTRPEQRPHLSCPERQWLAEPTSTQRTEARAATSPVVPATIVASCTYADQANRSQSSALTCRARHHSCWLSPCRLSKQRPELRPHLSWPPTQCLAEPTPT